jgi:DNA-binding Lrp family transcriptional regulator
MASSLHVDRLDRQILAALEQNARQSFAAIGGKVGLSASAVKRRVDRLLGEQIITGFHASVDHAALGGATEAFVELFCTGRTSAQQIGQLADKHPEVVAAYTVTGEANALLRLRTSDTSHLEQALERIRKDRSVVQTRSHVVLSRLLAPDLA